jgi:hypothetical protein
MENIYRQVLLITGVIILFLPIASQAQQNPEQLDFIQRFNSFQDELPRESVVLHTDRPWYFHGDRIWFSAYVTTGADHQLSHISELLYVELYNPEGDMIERVNIEIEEGRGEGSITFEQQDDVQTGHYELRAYIAWALNFGESYAFRRQIPVYEAGEQISSAAIPEASDIDLQFMPEGGQLVAGIEQRVGFKAIGTDGHGREVSGFIENQQGEIVAQFQSAHKGMGRFTLTPEEGEQYTAVLNHPTKNLVSQPSLTPVSEGVALKVEPDASQFNIRAEKSSNAIPEPMMVFGHVRGEVYFAAALQPSEGAGLAWAPSEVFPAGVIHFTILDGDGRPVAERLAYNHNDATIADVELAFRDGDAVQTREQAALEVKLPDEETKTLFSISVYDDELADYDEYAPGLHTQLLLESDLRGHVEQPGYYFSDEVEAGAHLDLLMMTQGWRAYDMPSLYERRTVDLSFLPEKGFKVSGTLTTLIRQRPLEDAVIHISLDDSEEQSFVTTTDENGRFVLDGLDIQGNVLVNMRANREEGSDRLRINLDDQFDHLPDSEDEGKPLVFNPIPAESLSPLNYAESVNASDRVAAAQSAIEENVETQMQVYLEEVIVTAERQRRNMDERQELRDLPLARILARLPGVQRKSGPNVMNTASANLSLSQSGPYIIVDGIPTDIETIRYLDTKDVLSIDVYRPTVELGSYGNSGVVEITTRRGANFQGSRRGQLSAMINGYQLPTSFYAPRYGFTVDADTIERDQRITLYWNPAAEIERNDSGEARYFFWANDIPGRYRVQVEGLTQSGKVFSKTTTFEIEP